MKATVQKQSSKHSLSKVSSDDVNTAITVNTTINFTGNLSGNNNTLIFFIIEEVKETILDFSQGTLKLLYLYFALNNINIK